MAITQTTDIASAATLAYELAARMQLRAAELYSTSRIMKVTGSPLSHRGDQVRFWFYDDLATNVTALTEDTDVTAKKIAESQVDVSMDEYGDAVGRTRKAKGTDMLELDMALAALNGRQMADSFELLARTPLLAGTNVHYGGTGNAATADVAAGDLLTAALVREVVGRMRNDSVDPVIGDKYLATITPYQSIDLREETGDAAWLPVHNNVGELSGGIVNGMIGTFGGAVFVESSRVSVVVDGGTANADVAQALFLGGEALACAYSTNVSGPTPNVEISPVVDKLNRFAHVGWYWLGGFGILRQEAVRRVETATRVE